MTLNQCSFTLSPLFVCSAGPVTGDTVVDNNTRELQHHGILQVQHCRTAAAAVATTTTTALQNCSSSRQGFITESCSKQAGFGLSSVRVYRHHRIHSTAGPALQTCSSSSSRERLRTHLSLHRRTRSREPNCSSTRNTWNRPGRADLAAALQHSTALRLPGFRNSHENHLHLHAKPREYANQPGTGPISTQ